MSPPRSRPGPAAHAAGPAVAQDDAALRRALWRLRQTTRSSGLAARILDDPAGHRTAAGLLQRIWNHPGGPPLTPEMLRALSHENNYVGAVFDGPVMVAAAAGFRSGSDSLHSHIAGVQVGYRHRSAGYLLKLHQRVWALRQGLRTITWTFDPLVRRNAYFNLVKVGAAVAEYLPDFYGDMADAVNAGDRSDRLLVRWELADRGSNRVIAADPDAVPALAPDEEDRPRTAPGLPSPADRLIAVPADVEALRRRAPEVAAEWRMAVRDAVIAAAGADYRIAGLDTEHRYVLRHTPGGGPAPSP